jgi:hypothetical protein
LNAQSLAGVVLLAFKYIQVKYLVFISKDEQLFVENLTELRVVNGPMTYFLPLLHKTAVKKKCKALGQLEYIRVRNTLTGEVRVETGELMSRRLDIAIVCRPHPCIRS